MPESLTSMYNCTHGPKKDCHACLVPELVNALETAMARREPNKSYTLPVGWFRDTRALIEKARLIEDCIPVEKVSGGDASNICRYCDRETLEKLCPRCGSEMVCYLCGSCGTENCGYVMEAEEASRT